MGEQYSSENQKKRAASRWGPPEPRFWAKVDKRGPDECWPWKGAVSTGGYGAARHPDGYQTTAHRVAYYYANGEIPDGMNVLHSCDNPPCCNPSHLWCGTAQDNVDDKVKKGRASGGSKGRYGEKNNGAKISREQAESVIFLYRIGAKQFEIAALVGVKRQNVWAIVHGKSWSEVVSSSRR